ncbi:hypothetical protein [Alkalibacillus silvisoli]|uniref:Zinc ribbon domain-containing protein n=1 Tax=Alkalibacillus silvisoli TaxID=392823 RepID=A0ABP3K2Q2_9BACI
MGAFTCSICYNQQGGGNFCENCGNALVNGGQQVIQVKQPPLSRSRQQVAQPSALGIYMKKYSEYYKSTLKNPTHAFKQSEAHYANAIVTLFILSISLALGIYLLINAQGTIVDANAFQLISQLVAASLVVLASGLVAFITVLKIGDVDLTLKQATTQYGTLAVPFSILTMLSVLTGLSSSTLFTLTLSSMGLLIFVTFIPAIASFFHLLQSHKHHMAIYLSLLTFGLTNLIIYIMFRIYLADVWSIISSL